MVDGVIEQRSPQPGARIAKKSDVFHLIRQGILFEAFYDTETTDLDKRFAELTQFGGMIRDLGENPLYMADYRAKPSPYTMISPFAWVIQRMTEEKLESGEPPYIFAGRVMQFFRYANNLHEAPFAEKFLNLCQKRKIERKAGTGRDPDDELKGSPGEKPKEEDYYYAYPLMNDDGTVDWDSVRVHKNFKDMSFLDPENGQWTKRRIAAGAYGYNNVSADDQWIWTALHMACAENIFVTHMPKFGKYRVDVLRSVEAAYAAGPKGERGIRPGVKTDPVSKRRFLSFSQGDILEANTRFASELRELAEGIVLPDGSYPDVDQLHGAFKDAFALGGIVSFLRRTNPRFLIQMEQNAFWIDVINRLRGVRGKSGDRPVRAPTRQLESRREFGDRPILAYVDKCYPFITGRMISLIGTDQQRHNPKVALVYNLSIDPKTFRFNGRTFKELTPEEIGRLILESKDDQNGAIKIIRTHQSPRLLSREDGFAAGFNNGLTLPELHERVKFWRDKALCDKVMEGFRIAEPRMHGPGRLALPQPEEEMFSFSTLEMFDPEAGEDVDVHLVLNRLEKMAQDSRRHALQVKKLWLKAIEPDEDFLLNDYGGNYTEEQNAIGRFLTKLSGINSKLKENGGPLLPEKDGPVDDIASARRYKIKLLFFARNAFAQGRVEDIGHHFWFEDRNGHRLSEKDLMTWPQWRLDRAYQAGDLNIRNERINVTAPIIDRILEGLGFVELLGDEARKQLDAVKALRTHGIATLNGKDRWYTLHEAVRDLAKIENNELAGEDVRALEKRMPGVWATFLSKHHDSQASLAEYKRWLAKRAAAIGGFTPMQKLRAGLHPATGEPLQKVEFKVNLDRAGLIPIPDRVLEKPLIEPRTGRPLWLVPLSETFNRQSLEGAMRGGSEIILTGRATGKKYHLVKPALVKLPERGGLWGDFYKAAKARFADSGLALPEPEGLAALIGEGPYPLHEDRGNVSGYRTLMVPRRRFEGLLNHEFASFPEKVTGMIVRDDGLSISEGRVRLLEQEATGYPPTGWEVASTVTRVRTVCVAELKSMSEDEAPRYGYMTQDEMIGDVMTQFAEKKLDPRNPYNRVWVLDFGEINPFDPKEGTMYFNPEAQKISAAQIDYKTWAMLLSLET